MFILVGSIEGNRQLERYKCEGEVNKTVYFQDKDDRLEWDKNFRRL
jgi:hypothetical protein